MSLLTDASLLVTPNAEKEGKLYSIIPANGNGDFTVTRATTATRVNASSLVELVPYNLAQYSEMFSDAVWTKNGTTIGINTTIAPNGTLTADTITRNGSSQFNPLSENVSVISGLNYTFSVYAKKDTNDFIQIFSTVALFTGNFFANFDLNTGVVGTVGSAILGASISSVGNGWYRCAVSGPAVASGNSNCFAMSLVTLASASRAQSNTLTTSVFLWGAQAVEGTSALDYQLTQNRLNIPRIDYSLGGCPNILLEPQRTNICLWSEQFDNAAWTGTATIGANSYIAPNGVLSADILSDISTTQYQTKAQTFTITANAAYTTSVFIRKTTGAVTSYPGISVLLTSVSARIIRVILNTTTGAFNYESSGTTAINSYSATITSFNSDYWRLTLTTQDNASNTSYQIIYTPAISLDGTTITVTATGSVTLWGAQVEAGAYATSYIPTTSANVTRNQDQITRNNIYTNGLITASGGTWFVELRNNRSLVRDAASQFWVGDTNTTSIVNGFTLRGSSISARIGINKVVASVTTSLFTTTTDSVKIAIKWNGSTADVFQNGVKVVSATAFTTTNMEFLNGFAADVPKYINEMILYPTPLSDTQCIALTT
jgi:hypothetical protein